MDYQVAKDTLVYVADFNNEITKELLKDSTQIELIKGTRVTRLKDIPTITGMKVDLCWINYREALYLIDQNLVHPAIDFSVIESNSFSTLPFAVKMVPYTTTLHSATKRIAKKRLATLEKLIETSTDTVGFNPSIFVNAVFYVELLERYVVELAACKKQLKQEKQSEELKEAYIKYLARNLHPILMGDSEYTEITYNKQLVPTKTLVELPKEQVQKAMPLSRYTVEEREWLLRACFDL